MRHPPRDLPRRWGQPTGRHAGPGMPRRPPPRRPRPSAEIHPRDCPPEGGSGEGLAFPSPPRRLAFERSAWAGPSFGSGTRSGRHWRRSTPWRRQPPIPCTGTSKLIESVNSATAIEAAERPLKSLFRRYEKHPCKPARSLPSSRRMLNQQFLQQNKSQNKPWRQTLVGPTRLELVHGAF